MFQAVDAESNPCTRGTGWPGLLKRLVHIPSEACEDFREAPPHHERVTTTLRKFALLCITQSNRRNKTALLGRTLAAMSTNTSTRLWEH